MHVRTTAAELARWLDGHGGLWTIDGEPTLGVSLPVPAAAEAIAKALTDRRGEIVILVPDGCTLAADSHVDFVQLPRAAHMVDSHHVYQLAWIAPDGVVSDSWLLAEHDALAQSGETGAAAARLVASWREGWRASAPRIVVPSRS